MSQRRAGSKTSGEKIIVVYLSPEDRPAAVVKSTVLNYWKEILIAGAATAVGLGVAFKDKLKKVFK